MNDKKPKIEEDIDIEEDDVIDPILDEALQEKGIILLENESGNSALFCKKALIDLAYNPNIVEITIYINSPGGDFASFVSLHDIILAVRKQHKKKVTTIVNGIAASGAALVLQAGNPRLATKNSYIMIHEASTSMDLSKTSDLMARLEMMKKFQKTAFKIWADKMKLSVKELQEIVGREDWYLSAKEAKANLLIDEII